MALTAQDKSYLDAQKAKGLSFDEAYTKLQSIKTKLGTTTQPVVTPEKAGIMDVLTGDMAGKQNLYGETIPEESDFSKNLGALTPVGSTIELGKGLLKAGAGAASLFEKASNTILPEKLQTKGGTLLKDGAGETLGEQFAASESLESDSAVGKAENFVGQYVLPSVAGGVVGTGAKLLGGKSKLASGLLGFLGSSTGGTTAYSVSDRGELPTAKELAVGATIDAVTLGAFKAFPVIGRGLKNTFSKIYSTAVDQGASPMTIETLKQIKGSVPEAKSVMEGLVAQEKAYLTDNITNPSTLMTVGESMFRDFTDEMLPAKQAVGQELASQIGMADDLAQAGSGLTSEGVLKSLTDGLDSIRVPIVDGAPDFSKSTIRFSEANQSMLKKVFADVSKYTQEGSFIPPSEKWSLAQALGDLTDYNAKLASQVTGKGEIPIIKLKGDLLNDVKASLEESGQAVDLFDQYRTLSEAIDSLNLRLGEGGEGGFSVLKALHGEQKFGQEVREALESMKGVTGVDYVQQVKMALAAADIAGNQQVKSLLTTTSGKGALLDVITNGMLDKELLLKRLSDEVPDVDKVTLEKITSAVAKALGLEVVGED